MVAAGLGVLAAGVFVAQSMLLAALLASWLQDGVAGRPVDLHRLWHILPWFVLCLMARPSLLLVRDHLALRVSVQIRQQVRLRLLESLARLGPARSAFGADGALASMVIEETDALDGYLSRYYAQRYVVVFVPLMLLVATFLVSPLAGLVMLLTAPLVPLFMGLVGHLATRNSDRQLAALSRLAGRFLDLMRGLPTLQRLNAADQAARQVELAAGQYRQRTFSVLKLAFLSSAVLEFFASVAIALLAVYLGLGLLGILPWAKGAIPVPYEGALFILLLAPEFYAPLRQLGTDYHAKAQAEAAVGRLSPLLQAASGLVEGTREIALHQPPSIQLDAVSVATPEGRIRLASQTWQAAGGQRIGLTGPSGCGKSTLLQAVLGFVPFVGEIRIQDQSLHQLHLGSLRAGCGVLGQQSPLLPGSIAWNLRLARPEATDDELVHVLERVELWPWVRAMPMGLHTPLGERGRGLSGGQQQRLAIAQLLLREAPLWLLDEPCAHLDPETAARIHRLLDEVTRGRTLLLVTHQLEGLDWLDRVIRLEGAEEGFIDPGPGGQP
jgi:ATP-binding cassette subfamily C protein CydD